MGPSGVGVSTDNTLNIYWDGKLTTFQGQVPPSSSLLKG